MMFDTTNKKGVTELGIVALHGDVLLICTARNMGVPRPTVFKVEAEKKHVLTVWKRELKEDAD
jgi:hypothetical protein